MGVADPRDYQYSSGETIIILQYLRGFPNFFVFKCSEHDISILERVGVLKFSVKVPRIGGSVNNRQTIVFACATLWSGVDVRRHFLLAQHAPKPQAICLQLQVFCCFISCNSSLLLYCESVDIGPAYHSSCDLIRADIKSAVRFGLAIMVATVYTEVYIIQM